MKKLIFLFFAIVFFANFSFSQITFQRIGGDTTVAPPSPVLTTNAYAFFKNTSANPINVRFIRILNDLPAGWSGSICVGQCYPSDVDTVPMMSEPPLILAPNAQDTMDITFFNPTEGIGTSVIKIVNVNNPAEFITANFILKSTTVGIKTISETAENYELSQNYPNPFNPVTYINFSIPQKENVSLIVYDILGNEIARLINNNLMNAGSYKLDFDATYYKLSSGVYIYKLITPSFTTVKRMMLIK